MSDRNAIKASAEAAVQEQKDWVAAGSKWPQATLKLWVFRAHMNPEAALELIRQLEQRENGPSCWTCGDMGHVSRIDGEYLGVCNDCNVYELSCVKHDLAQAQQVIAEHVEPVSVNTMQRREQWLQNITDAIKFGLPSQLRERLQYTAKQIQASMRYGGTKRLRDQIERLTAEVERKDEEYDKAWRHDLNDKNNVQVLAEEVARLNAELALLKPDADRYRWIRDIAKMRFKPSGSSTVVQTAAATDAAIDEEMRKELQP